jgi:hypothetical protein
VMIKLDNCARIPKKGINCLASKVVTMNNPHVQWRMLYIYQDHI